MLPSVPMEGAIKDTFLITTEDYSCNQSFLLQWEESQFYKYAMKEKETNWSIPHCI